MKIKKFLVVLIAIIALVMGYFLVQNYNHELFVRYFQYQDRIAQIEKKELIPIDINVSHHNTENVRDFFKKLVVFCKDRYTFHINYSIPKENGTGKISNFSLYTDNQDIINDLATRNIKGISFNNLEDKKYITTDLSDQASAGKLELIDNAVFDRYDGTVRIETLNNSIEKLGSLETMPFCFYSNDVKGFESELDQFLEAEGLSSTVSYTNFYGSYAGAQLEQITNQNITKLLSIAAYTAIIYVLFFVVYIAKHKKSVLIQRVHGISVFKIVKDNTIVMLVNNYVIFNLLFYGSAYYFSRQKLFGELELIKQMIIVSLGLLFFFVLAFILIYIATAYSAKVDSLKRQAYSNKNVFIALAIKVLVLILVTAPLLEMFSSAYANGKGYQFFNKNKELFKDLCYIEYGFSTLDNQELVFNYFLENDGIFCNFEYYYFNTYEYLKETFPTIYDEEGLAKAAITYPVIYVNENYLKSLDKSIYTVNGKKLDLSKFTDEVLLVPEACHVDDFSTMTFGSEKEIIKVKNNGMFINYRNDDTPSLNNPVIYLVKKKNVVFYFDQLFIPEDKNNPTKINNIIKDLCGDEDVKIVSNNKTIASKIADIYSEFKETFVLLCLYALIYIGIIYQTVFWFIEEFKKTLLLEYLFGKSKYERYFKLFFLNIVFYLIPLICCVAYQDVAFGGVFKLYLLTIIFEILTMYILIQKTEKDNANIILKGESGL